jgi:hypothetical protein
MISDWKQTTVKRIPKSIANQELVTGRVSLVNNKVLITISIGVIVCDLLEIKNKDYLNVFFHKKVRDVILIRKTHSIGEGYKLCKSHTKSNFMHFSFRLTTFPNYRLSQTTALPFDIEDENLLVNIEKLKWRN